MKYSDVLKYRLARQAPSGAMIGVDGKAISPQGRGLFRWIFGDLSNTTSVAVGTPATSDPVDVSLMTDAAITVVTSGGTLAIAFEVSPDGKRWSSHSTIATGVAAGTYAYSLPFMGSGFCRFVLTATGSTCTVRSFVCGTSATSSMATRRIVRGVCGDGSAAVALAASAAVVSPPIDLTKCVRGSSELRIVVASGTVNVSASVSRNGYDDLVSLGNIQTGITAGSYTVALSSLAKYGHFVTFTVTESAASTASVSAIACLSVADDLALPGATIRPAGVMVPLGGTAGAEWTTNYSKSTMAMYSALLRMGYDAEILPLYDSSPIMDSGAKLFEFIVWPHSAHSGLWNTWTSGSGKPVSRLIKGETFIPVLCTGVTSNNNANLLANIGAGVRTTETNQKLLVGSSEKVWYMPYQGTYTVTVQSHMGSYSVFVQDAAKTGAVAWKYKGTNGWVYVGAGFNGAADCNMFPILMAEAVKDGVIPAPPKKLAAVIDIDDCPACDGGATGTMTIADMERIYAAMSRMSMPCTWGIRPQDIVGGRQSAAVSRWVSDRLAKNGGLIYPIAHSGNWYWKDSTKTTKDTTYRSDLATINGAGIPATVDADGYYYFNNNAFDADTLDLGTPQKSVAASIADSAIQAGYGWKVVRAEVIGGLNTEGFGEPDLVFGECYYRGIKIVACNNYLSSTVAAIDFDDGSTGSTTIAHQNSQWLRFTLCYGSPTYIHGENCFDGHDGGNAPGTRWLELVAGLYEYSLSNVIEFVHGSKLAN